MTNQKRDRLYALWFALIVLSFLLVLFALAYASFTPYEAGRATPTPPPADASADVEGVQLLETTALLPLTADAGDAYVSRITFLADAATYGLKTYGLLEGGENTTKVLATADGVLSLSGIASARLSVGGSEQPVAGAVSSVTPDILIITVGIDGAAYMGETYFNSEYASLIASIKSASPNTVIVCSSILPVSESYATANSLTVDAVKTANNWIQQTASDNSALYLNAFDALADENGCLQAGYDSGNGLTCNSAGLYAFLDYIKTHAVS